MASSAHLFSQIPQANIPRSTFKRDYDYKTTFDSGYLIPFLVDEVLPGDTFKMKASLFTRLSTPIVPIMDNMYLETFLFFVPCRLVWDNWEKFNGEQRNPGDSTDFLIPKLANNNGFEVQSIFDYCGIPTGIPITDYNPINALPFRAMNLIWNEWFRDENLQDSLEVPTGDGPDPIANYNLLTRQKRHDFFTSSLPFRQKGPSEGISIGLTGDLPVVAGNAPMTLGWKPQVALSEVPAGTLYSYNSNNLVNLGVRYDSGGAGDQDGNAQVTPWDYYGGLQVNLSNATSISINDLRTAFQLQKLLERDARGG